MGGNKKVYHSELALELGKCPYDAGKKRGAA
jgi:hypothetical protein